MAIISQIFLLLGAVFYLLGGLGILRMPDTFDRIQAGTKATTLGAFSILLGVGFAQPGWLLKIVLIIIFIAISNPIGSSVIAKATYKSYEKPTNLKRDDIKELFGGEINE
ncbi:MAG: monovalent cation/H(+) antiporter subunit G [Candidatus Izimaplasma sp.]|nr:monovalent cation/H(+) antiporter subunit G [Candidatus Izimaplasma bacterium]